jgi:hypothetical protein
MRLRIATILAALPLMFFPSVVAASAPTNDNFAAATAITSLPYSATIDLSNATVEPNEDISTCYASSRTVWYRFTPPLREILDIDITGSDPDVGLRIYFDFGSGIGPPGFCLSAAYPTAQLLVDAATTLYFQVTSDTGTAAVLHVGSEPVLAMSSTLDSTASIDRATGTTVFHGTVSCNKPAFAQVLVTAYQRQGRKVVVGQGWSDAVNCGATPTAWTARAYGGLVSGSASTSWSASSWTSTGLSEGAQDAGGPIVVQIKPR